MTTQPGSFSTEPCVKVLGHRRYLLEQGRENPFWYITRAGLWVCPPRGMRTDLGSIPDTPLLNWAIPPDEWPQSYITHDWLCYSGLVLQPISWATDAELVRAAKAWVFAEDEHRRLHSVGKAFHIIRSSRAFADSTLRECLAVEGCGIVKRTIIYTAVAVYGHFTQHILSAKRNKQLIRELT